MDYIILSYKAHVFNCYRVILQDLDILPYLTVFDLNRQGSDQLILLRKGQRNYTPILFDCLLLYSCLYLELTVPDWRMKTAVHLFMRCKC
jgi:hypothetical protein